MEGRQTRIQQVPSIVTRQSRPGPRHFRAKVAEKATDTYAESRGMRRGEVLADGAKLAMGK